MLGNKKLKRIMTDLPAGHITKKEADEQMEKPKKSAVRGSKQGKSTIKSTNTQNTKCQKEKI